jgi:hypothetical protein
MITAAMTKSVNTFAGYKNVFSGSQVVSDQAPIDVLTIDQGQTAANTDDQCALPHSRCERLIVDLNFACDDVERKPFGVLIEKMLITGPFNMVSIATTFGGWRR